MTSGRDMPDTMFLSSCMGLTDKLYWRRTLRGWHCFKRASGTGGRRHRWTALCDDAIAIGASDGQDSRRPPSWLRCPRCDGIEASRRGWDECGPDHATREEAANYRVLPLLRRAKTQETP